MPSRINRHIVRNPTALYYIRRSLSSLLIFYLLAIQVNLMQHLFRAIEERKVALVESPTGTVRATDLLLNSDPTNLYAGKDFEPSHERADLALPRQKQGEESSP